MSLYQYITSNTIKTTVVMGILMGVAQAQVLVAPTNLQHRPGIKPDREYISLVDYEKIDTYNGSLKIRHKDMVLPGNNGFDLEVTRVYDSTRLIDTSYLGNYAGANKLLSSNIAPGWSIHFGRLSAPSFSNVCNSNPTGNNGQYGVVLELGNGETIDFMDQTLASVGHINASNTMWKIDCANSPSNGSSVLIKSPKGYTYTMSNKKTVGNSETWFTQSIQDPYGNAIYVTYNNSYTYSHHPEIVSVNRTDGRSVAFNYSNHPSITVVGTTGSVVPYRILSSISAGGETFTYSYGSNLLWAGLNLNVVTRPDATQWNFAYVGAPSVCSVTSPAPWCIGAPLHYIKPPYSASSSTLSYTYSMAMSCNGLYEPKITQRNLTINGGNNFTNFAYSTGNIGVPVRTMTETIVTSSGSPKVNKYHYTMASGAANSGWQIGLLARKETGNAEVINYAYQKQTNASRPLTVADGCTTMTDSNGTGVARMSQKSITRISGGTSQYNTAYSSFDWTGNPLTIAESNVSGSILRTTNQTYQHITSASKWILSLPLTVSNSGKNITNTYNSNGSLLSNNENGIIKTYVYNNLGDKISYTDPNGNLYTYGPSINGIITNETQPNGITYVRNVDIFGNITSENLSGSTTTYNYLKGSLKKLNSIIYPTGNQINFAYQFAQYNTTTITRGGYTETYTFDELERVKQISNNASPSLTRQFSYDVFGNLFQEISTSGGTSKNIYYSYDQLNREISRSSTPTSSVQTNYTENGGLSISQNFGNGNYLTHIYRSYGEPSEKYLIAIHTPMSSISMTYTPFGKVSTMSSGSKIRNFTYDTKQYLANIFDGELDYRYTRDNLGNMLSQRVNGGPITYFTYNGQNQLTSITYPGTTPAVTFNYNNRNLLTGVNNTVASKAYTYDLNGNVTGESLVTNGYTFSTGYAYNGQDQLTTVVYPLTGRVLNLSPNVLGNATSIPGFTLSAATYNGFGQLTSLNYANNVVNNLTYSNSTLYPASHTIKKTGGSSYLDSIFAYSGTGNLLSVVDATNAYQARNQAYDTNARLIQQATSYSYINMKYDSINNIIAHDINGSSNIYNYSLINRLTSTNGYLPTTMSYDLNGNIINDGQYTYNYNAASDMTCARCNIATQINSFAYDGQGKRISVEKVNASGALYKTYEVYGYDGKLLLEFTPSTNTTKEHIYFNKQRIAQVDTVAGVAQTRFIHNDIFGSPILATDSTGASVWTEAYLPFGQKVVNATSSLNNSIGFLSKPYDNQTGLIYDKHYYNPALGRYMSVHSLAFNPNDITSFNRYVFEKDNIYNIEPYINTKLKPILSKHPNLQAKY